MEYNNKMLAIKKRFESMKIYYYNEVGKKDELINRKNDLDIQLETILCNIHTLEKVRILLQKASEFAREQSRKRIETLVTNCLQLVFDAPIEFKIEINEVRGRAEAEFYVISYVGENIIKTKPQDARGGGIIDIISLSIRIAMLESNNLDIDGPIILDEPAKHVSDDFIIPLSEFLKQASIVFERQIIMVTHNRHLSEIADKSFRIEMKNGISIIDYNSNLKA